MFSIEYFPEFEISGQANHEKVMTFHLLLNFDIFLAIRIK